MKTTATSLACGAALYLLVGAGAANADMSACQYAHDAEAPKDKITGYTTCLRKGHNGASVDAVIYTYRANAYADLGDLDSALKDYTSAIERDPQFDAPFELRGEIYANRGEWSKAQADFDAAIARTRDGNNKAVALLHKAWLFATWPDASMRDGAKAISLAQEAFRLRDYALSHDVLAAAHAEAGQFDEAVREEAAALSRLQRDNDRAKPSSREASFDITPYEARLALYRMMAPYHTAVPFPRTAKFM